MHAFSPSLFWRFGTQEITASAVLSCLELGVVHQKILKKAGLRPQTTAWYMS